MTTVTVNERPTIRREDLTVEQVLILRFAAEGLRSRAIAEAMCVPHETIKSRISDMLERTGSRNVCHATAMAIRAGLI